MIGIFGIFKRDRSAQADADMFVRKLRSPAVARIASDGCTGAAIGTAVHVPRAAESYFRSSDGALTIACCGTIYNIGEVCEDPGLSVGIAACLARLYQTGRLNRLATANGQFAAAIYDHTRHRLTLITDRLATFPIHVWSDDREVVFASHIHTLLQHSRIRRQANPQAIRQLFTMQRTIGRTSPVAGVQGLPAATIVEYETARHSEQSYWSLRWTDCDFDLEEGAQLLASALRNALGRQMTAKRCSLLLSGGIDSRLVLSAATVLPTCWTTASFEGNPELAIARELARQAGAVHHALIVSPADTLTVLDKTVEDSDGLYPASTLMSVFLPQVGAASDLISTGHALDYTLRGYYLPARFAEIGGSRTRLPVLRPILGQPTGASVLQNLRQGPPLATIDRIAGANRISQWWDDVSSLMQEALGPWLTSGDPYNAWDAFILHAVSRHYGFTSMASVRAVADLVIPAFDNEVFEIYLRMPPSWRCSGRMVQRTLQILSSNAARIKNANTGFPADLHPAIEVVSIIGRAALRRVGLARRPDLPSVFHSSGSWQNLDALYRQEPSHRAHFMEIRKRLDSLSFGVLDADALAACLDEHLDGRRSHTKLLRQLMTHDSWVRVFGIEGHA